MSVLERIKKGELSIRINTGIGSLRNVYAENELIELAEIGQRSQWIDCNKQMPNENVFVIAYGRYGSIMASLEMRCGELVWNMHFSARNTCDCLEDWDRPLWMITHWMPLPNAPK